MSARVDTRGLSLQILRRTGRTAVLRAALLAIAFEASVDPALAYRPFDGTDAAVADPGEVEIEFQPAGILREGPRRTVIAPAVIFNYGLIKNWELVLQGRGEFPYSPDRERTTFRENALLFKSVLRPGVLQGEAGPSIATEFGMLLPATRSTERNDVGASIAGIVSNRWSWFTAHFNLQAALSNAHEPDYFASTILEGPFDWVVRPVGELAYEWDAAASETRATGLIGAIWRAAENLSFDAAVREGRINSQPLTELRLGFTFGFSPW
jgi:hypothetical protein